MSDDIRLPPNSADAERAVLGAALVKPEMVALISAVITPADFYRKHHSLIWKAIVDLAEKGSPVDMLTVSQQLNDTDQRQYILGLFDDTYNPSSAVHYAKQIREFSRARALQKTLSALEQAVYDRPVDDLLHEAQTVLSNMVAGDDDDELMSSGEIIADVFDDLQFRCENPGKIFGIPTGYRDLDTITGGFDPGSLIIFGGRSGMGKTTMTVDIIKNILLHYKLDVTFFSIEMSKHDIMQKLLINQAFISAKAARDGVLDAKDWAQISKAAAEIDKGGKFHIFDRKCDTVAAIRRHLLNLPKMPAIVFIDHLHVMRAEDPRTQDPLKEVSMDLKQLAKDLNIPIVALCQLNRGLLSRGDDSKEPHLGDIRACGAIEENSDQVIFIHRPEYFNPDKMPGQVKLIVAKLRQAGDSKREAVLNSKAFCGSYFNQGIMGPLEFILKPSHIFQQPFEVPLEPTANIKEPSETPINIFALYETPINGVPA